MGGVGQYRFGRSLPDTFLSAPRVPSTVEREIQTIGQGGIGSTARGSTQGRCSTRMSGMEVVPIVAVLALAESLGTRTSGQDRVDQQV